MSFPGYTCSLVAWDTHPAPRPRRASRRSRPSNVSASIHAWWESSSGPSINARSTGFVWTGPKARHESPHRRSTRRRAASKTRRADVQVTTVGTSVVGAYGTRAGQIDALGWFAGQGGSWYEESHRAWSFGVEGGHQWTRAPWQPWIRAGVLYASGDDDPADTRHGTFFQMLPTGRRYSMTTAYSQMNLNDRFVQAVLKPHARWTVRADVHRLSLARADDGWYFGSGATQEEGAIFGFALRPSGGHTGLGTSVEASVDYSVNTHLSVNGFIAHMRGGDVVGQSFVGRDLRFGYIETLVRF